MAELKPCPFCGSTDLHETYSQEYALGTKNPEIFCNSCKIIFSIEDDSPYMNCEEDYVYRKNKTLEAWNRRATIEPDIIRCGECKHLYVDGENVRFNVCELNHNKVQNDDWFCADAERKEGEVE